MAHHAPRTRHQAPRTSPSRSPLYIFFSGAAMGAADVVPGVSGGTMAFILGIYEDLIGAIKSFNLNLLKLLLGLQLQKAREQIPWRFILPLVTGLGLAFVGLAGVIGWLLVHHPVPLYAFFTGLILASILTVTRHVVWRGPVFLALAAGTIGAWLLVGMVPAKMSHDPLTLFLSGMAAISAMLLPGLSGSFILLILGQYVFFITAVSTFNISALVPLAGGMLVGLMLFARVLSWLLQRWYQVIIALLAGFMLGSLRRIWPYKETLTSTLDRHGQTVPLHQINVLPSAFDLELLVSLTVCLLGFLVICGMDRIQSGSAPTRRRLK